ncbi:hypothetical protein [Aquaspirillum sp. LM1]|uniref:hypothetical protein n=1 Tax=Aquaspirillum sp. LM1 TaxID=1938604 RepID=UPI00123713FC|nr:hypothetical protein [Aquaspirillum sp. LM1]
MQCKKICTALGKCQVQILCFLFNHSRCAWSPVLPLHLTLMIQADIPAKFVHLANQLLKTGAQAGQVRQPDKTVTQNAQNATAVHHAFQMNLANRWRGQQ